MLIYGGEDGFPVAMQYVDPVAKSERTGWRALKKPTESIITYLFSVCTVLMTALDDGKSQLGDELIRDALDHARDLAEDDCIASQPNQIETLPN